MTMNTSEQTLPAAYFGSLTIENVKCFKGEQAIDLSDGNGNPAMWTVILGLGFKSFAVAEVQDVSWTSVTCYHEYV